MRLMIATLPFGPHQLKKNGRQPLRMGNVTTYGACRPKQTYSGGEGGMGEKEGGKWLPASRSHDIPLCCWR